MKTSPESHPAAPRRLVGYARISTNDPLKDEQVKALRAAGCHSIFREHGSENPNRRPVLAKLFRELAAGDILVVRRLDRLGLSLGELARTLEDLERRGVSLKSLADPVDTSTPEGKLSIAVIGAAAELERSFVAERTISGMLAARTRGRLAGNPGLRERRPEAIRAVAEARERRYLEQLDETAHAWLPLVQRLRPRHSWGDVVCTLKLKGQDWTVERLRRAVHKLVDEKRADPVLLERSPRHPPEHRLMRLVACISIADPDLSPRAIAAQLDLMHEQPPAGTRKWQSSSVRQLLDEAYRFGLTRV